ncbi:MAG TPA: hypothetical protein VE220_07835 [Gaiellaceae bacterium]|nr:hypothetical protein [Gaiellaceae bacterium]
MWRSFVQGDVRPVYEEGAARLSGADLWLVGGGDLQEAELIGQRIRIVLEVRRDAAGLIVGLLASTSHRPENAAVVELRVWWRGISIPQRLLIASALAYGGVFVILLEYGRPGLGLGEGFFIPVILAAAATSAPEGAIAGLGALVLYELAIHQGSGLTWVDFTRTPALTRLASYVAAGLVVGFLARRVRRMLAQSLVVLEDLMELAYGRLEEDERVPGAAARPSLE